MQPKGSLPHSQQPATCLYHKLDQSSPCPHFHLSKIHINIILLSSLGITIQVVSFPQVPHQSPLCTSPVTHTC